MRIIATTVAAAATVHVVLMLCPCCAHVVTAVAKNLILVQLRDP